MMAFEAVITEEPVARVDPEDEILGGAGGGVSLPGLRGGYASMAGHLLNVTESAGPWLADLMCLDEKIGPSIRTIKHGVQVQGHQLTATVSLDPEESPDDLTQEDIDTAFRIEDHCERCRRNLNGSWYELLNRMMDAMRYRTMLAEVVKRVADSGPDEGLYVLDHISPKDPATWKFVLDAYGNVRGIQAETPAPGALNLRSAIFPRDKFLILPWLPIGSRPWGQGLLGEAYNHWNFKVQVFPLLWKYIQLFALPRMVASPGETQNRSRRLVNSSGQPYGDEVSATFALRKELEDAICQNAQLLGVPPGTVLNFLTPPGNGAVFQFVFDLLDRAIIHAMHNTTLSLGLQGKRSNDTSSATGQDMLGLVVSYGKWVNKEMLERDLWYIHVLQNWGKEVADRFAPMVSFGQISPEDFSRNANSITRMYAVGLIAPQERIDALNYLGLNLARRKRKSAQPAPITKDPSSGGRPVNIKRRVA